MGLFRELYQAVEASVRARVEERGFVHGEVVRDLFCAFADGRYAVDDHAEKLLTELVEADILARSLRPEPSVSQRAFLGLSRATAQSIKNADWAPGTREAYVYFAGSKFA